MMVSIHHDDHDRSTDPVLRRVCVVILACDTAREARVAIRFPSILLLQLGLRRARLG